jgi:enoyl-CoA hydratase
MIPVVEDEHDPAEEIGISQTGNGDQQVPGQLIRRRNPTIGIESGERLDGHHPMMAHPVCRVAPMTSVGEAGAMALVSIETLRHHIRVVVLTGAGRAFCSGLELEHAGLPPGTEDLGRHQMGMRAMEYMGGIVPAMRAIPQPIVAAIKGPAYGGGMCLTLGADIRLAGRSAVFCGAGISNGLSGTELGVSWLLPRAVGTSNSAEILLTGRKVDADEALRIGLVSRVVDDDDVVSLATDMAETMCAFSPFGLALTKDTLWGALEIGSLRSAVDFENRTQLLAGHTGNLTEASAAFREKRPPVYTE